ncbi:MAG: hypothetical protein ABEK59_04295 [Halobacteria archaeon]
MPAEIIKRLRTEFPDLKDTSSTRAVIDAEGPNDKLELDTGENVLKSSRSNLGERVLKNYLDEILIILIASSDGITGKEIMTEAIKIFDTSLSPGTVYPHLHQLQEDGILEIRERVKSKEYTVADREKARQSVAELAREIEAMKLLVLSFQGNFE